MLSLWANWLELNSQLNSLGISFWLYRTCGYLSIDSHLTETLTKSLSKCERYMTVYMYVITIPEWNVGDSNERGISSFLLDHLNQVSGEWYTIYMYTYIIVLESEPSKHDNANFNLWCWRHHAPSPEIVTPTCIISHLLRTRENKPKFVSFSFQQLEWSSHMYTKKMNVCIFLNLEQIKADNMKHSKFQLLECRGDGG